MHSPGTVNNPFLAPWAHTATSNRRIPVGWCQPSGEIAVPQTEPVKGNAGLKGNTCRK